MNAASLVITNMKIIGISGKKKSGKSTIAELIDLYHPNVKILNFADAVKEQVAHAVGCDIEHINSHKDNFRLILQGWGTDYRRKMFGEDYWVKIWMQGVDTIARQHPSCLLVCADVRFDNEVSAIEQLSGQIWKVYRDEDIIMSDFHVSECCLDEHEFDVVISNNGTKEDLANTVRKLLNQR